MTESTPGQEAAAPPVLTVRELKKLASGRIRLTFDSGGALTVEPSVAADFALYTGRTLTDREHSDLITAAGAASARARAVRILSATAVSEQELRRRLRQKGETPRDADAAADSLRDLGLLDDGALAERLVRRELEKGYGPAHIRQSLYQKGISHALREQAMTLVDEEEEARSASLFLEKKLRGRLPEQEEANALITAIVRRGFSWDTAREALRAYQEAAEEESNTSPRPY